MKEKKPPMRERILIVEDDRIISKILNMKLQEAGYQVVRIVETGEDAIAEAIEELPDIVLMDISLQGKMDGIMGTMFIDAFLHIPVIFLTSHDDEITIRKAKSVNPATFLKKPFKSADVFTNIEIVCKNHHKIMRGMGVDLKETQENAKNITQSENPVFLTDTMSRIVYMNAAAQERFSIERKRSILKPINECVLLQKQEEETDTGTESVASSIFRNLISGRDEVMNITLPDGSMRNMLLKAQSITGMEGERIGLVVELRES